MHNTQRVESADKLVAKPQGATPKIAVVWSRWGPYHHARFRALMLVHGAENCVGVALAGKSNIYAWKDVVVQDPNFFVLDPAGFEEKVNSKRLFLLWLQLIKREKIEVAFLPSYWPLASALLIIASRLAGVRCVMMNDTHALTEKATGVKKKIKLGLIKNFHAGLVAGTPQRDYFIQLGMDPETLFDGYDVVDNDYFTAQANQARADAAKYREEIGLPQRYILNLGRMVEKKNLELLVRAYAHIAESPGVKDVALVLVGSGEEEVKLRELAISLGLKASDLKAGSPPADSYKTVFFAGFRQIDQNPIFFALAEFFVLPSHTEEWGLVINEAMACGAPILISNRVGANVDLVHEGVNGFSFDPNNVSELAQKMQLMLADPEKCAAMSEASRQIIAEWGCERFARNAVRAAQAARKK